MRWYCVHPSLPLQAELRIRIAPDFNASECTRIPQGRAVAACSPVFLVPNEDVDAEPTSWLQVAYQDPVSGETDGGFVMAALPDGTALVVPWEETNYYGCCEITNSTALLLDGPHDGARSVGSVQNTKLLYCTLEEGEKRFRIFHPELENVWIDKTDMRIVCTRLKHQQCKIPHTFIELNEALPDEAQIAIREFPSQKAQTVGLLSRGETLEVVVRCGNWLQIAGTDVDKKWIMWRTDALELLQEASDVRSNACIDIGIHLSAGMEAVSVVAAGDERPIRPARSEVEEEAHTSVQVVDDVSTNELEEECERVDISAGMEAVSVIAAGDERPIRPARSEVEEEAHTSVQVVDDVSTNEFEEECERVDISAGMEAVSVVAAGDERPIRPARSEVEEEAHTSVQVVDDVSTNEFEEECERVDISAGMEAVSVVAAGDERPIRPAREVEEEAHTSVQVVDDVSTNEFEEECERVDISAGMEAVSVIAAGDERPIRPARSEVEEEAHTSVQVVDDVSTNEFEEECERVDISAGMEAVSVVAAGDERPIRPARSEVEEEAHTSVQVVDDVSTNEFEEECERVDISAGMEAVSVVAAGDERPIRPARSEVEEEAHTSVQVVDDVSTNELEEECERVDISAGMEAVSVVAAGDERPIRPARSEVEEEAHTSVQVVDDVSTNEFEEECERVDISAGMEAVSVVAAGDERPIRPARSEVEEEAHTSVQVVDDVSTNEFEEECERVDISAGMEAVSVVAAGDERPIRPARSEVEEEAHTSVQVVDDVSTNELEEECERVAISAGMEAVSVVAAGDERPIRPARSEVEEEAHTSVQVVDDVSTNEFEEECERVDISAGMEAVSVVAAGDERPIRPARSEVEEEAHTSVQVVDDVSTNELEEECERVDISAGMEAVSVVAAGDERPIRPARSEVEEEAHTSVQVVDDVSTNEFEEECERVDISAGMEAVSVVAAGDERPIRPARSEVEEEAHTSVQVVDDVSTNEFEEECERVDISAGMEAVSVVAAGDERPIRPARSEVEEEAHTSVQVVDDVSTNEFEEECERVDISAGMEAVSVVAAGDERPIRPARSEVEEEAHTSVQVVDDVSTNEFEEECERVDISAGMEAVSVVAAGDERPIRPAREVEEEAHTSVQVVDDVSTNELEEECERVDISAGMEAVSVVAAGDERPIRPARSEVEEEAHTSVQVVDDVSTNEFEEECERVDISAGMEAVSVVAAGDERPIRPARSEVEEEAHTSVQVVDDVSTNELEEECERVDISAGMEAVSVVAAGDERPIRPARSEVEEEAHTSVQVVDDVSTNEFEEECERVDISAGMEAVSVVAAGDERPIRPARSEVEEEAHTSVQVVDDVSTNEFEEECERVDISAGMEAVSVVAAGDERPIRPARSEVEEEAHTSVQVVDDVSTNEFEEECERVDISAGMEAVSVVAAGDERPIRPAREVEEEAHTSVQVVDDVSTNELEEECERVAISAGMEAVSVVAAGDERPIRPARSEVEEEAHTSVQVVDDVSTNEFEEECERVDISAGMEAVSVVAAGDERPIRPARSEVEEEAHTSVQVVDDVSTNELEEECERVDISAGMEAVSVVAAGDERPIRPARSEVEEEAHTSVQVVDDVSTNEFEEECERVDISAGMEVESVVAGGDDERPIRPARSEVEEVVDVLIKVLASTGADFEGRDVMENFTAKYAAASAMYGSVGCTGETTGSAPESDAGDIVVLGNLDDAFEAVDEIFVGIAGGENIENAVCDYNDTLSQEKEQLEFVSGACDVTSSSFTITTQLEPNVKVPDNTTSALASFLQEFGVIEYCERKKALYPANDRLSQAMFNADQDDTDLLFEVFVGDDPLSDEWFHDVAPKGSVHFASLAATNPSLKTTYALIMGGATAEAILESELDDDDGDYDLVNSFRYPLPIRSRPSPLKPPLRQRQSASPDSFPEAPKATIDQAVPPASRLDQRKFIEGARSIAKPPSTLIRPRSFTHTPAFTSKAPIESTIGQAAPAASPSKPPEPLVQRKSVILTPKLQKISTSASSIPEPAAPSGLSMPRTSFGFRRPSSSRRK
ncbi:hypothetical protein DVH05_002426 [Phytophthora capsici]|nr:hypothetical protein DVH05_002426 [Phytophthora capsici]